tara:strand:- start:68 stop:916 length:849 start_codon:yes stop_codon:yes gene_type:complete
MAKRGKLQHRIGLVAGLSARVGARVKVCTVLSTAVLLWASAPGHAESKSPKFLGQNLSASAEIYIVLTDANVRGKPLTKSPRVGRVRKGIRIQAAGKAKGTNWVAVRKEGEDWGFVYAPALAPVLDGAIPAPLSGKLAGDDLPECEYNIRYEGRHPVDGDVQIISDYTVALSCDMEGGKLAFTATMFLTELPYQDLRRDIFQVNVDLPEVKDKEEEIMSVTSLYEYGKKEVAFDAVTIDSMARPQPKNKKKAEAIPAVLRAALEFAHAVWGPGVWAALGKTK